MLGTGLLVVVVVLTSCMPLKEDTVTILSEGTTTPSNGTESAVTGQRISTNGIVYMAHTCAIHTDETVRCWGRYDNGTRPTVPADLGTVTSISAGQSHNCAIKTNGTAQCWGYNTYNKSTVPSDLGTITSISAGRHTCAIKTNGTAQCWGDNHIGPVPTDLGAITSIGVGRGYTCVIKTGGTVQCWGANAEGASTPPSDLGTVSDISVNWGTVYSNTCAIKTNGTAQCWGHDGYNKNDVHADFQ
jgi:alpha-tubulin suppressor-like RCC1 family protein